MPQSGGCLQLEASSMKTFLLSPHLLESHRYLFFLHVIVPKFMALQKLQNILLICFALRQKAALQNLPVWLISKQRKMQ